MRGVGPVRSISSKDAASRGRNTGFTNAGSEGVGDVTPEPLVM
ncbi:hypothetical protein CEV31_3266 [Brucella thiophenivorans]|uniref:Uncharacterized protein n=1 Tax=Brucella thiophenivorans TaxID=571255 RepID=A0A256FJQ5_9HYPH|nr:hypothetical protein CEV31_3266 [Brucella thiophenivorans]